MKYLRDGRGKLKAIFMDFADVEEGWEVEARPYGPPPLT